MGGDALGRRIVALSATIALVAGCSRPAVAPRDASSLRAPEGVTDAQPASAAAAPADAATTTAPTDAAATTAPADATTPAAPTDDATTTAPTAGTARTAAGTDGSDPGRDPHRMRRVLGWVSLSIGAEAAVVALATSILIEHQKSVRDDGCNAQKVCDAAGFAAVNTIDTIVPWNTATWFIAAAGVGLGTVLLIISPSKSEQKTAITLSPGPSGPGLGLRSTF